MVARKWMVSYINRFTEIRIQDYFKRNVQFGCKSQVILQKCKIMSCAMQSCLSPIIPTCKLIFKAIFKNMKYRI